MYSNVKIIIKTYIKLEFIYIYIYIQINMHFVGIDIKIYSEIHLQYKSFGLIYSSDVLVYIFITNEFLFISTIAIFHH